MCTSNKEIRVSNAVKRCVIQQSAKESWFLLYIPDNMSQKMCNPAVEADPWMLELSDQYKTQNV